MSVCILISDFRNSTLEFHNATLNFDPSQCGIVCPHIVFITLVSSQSLLFDMLAGHFMRVLRLMATLDKEPAVLLRALDNMAAISSVYGQAHSAAQ